jgi:glycosyltransferase involved in cell wall biosynthesis
MASYLSFVLTSALAGSVFLPRPDYLLVESPPLFLGMAAWWLTRVRGGRLIFNVSDLWPASAVNLGVVDVGGVPYRLARRLEAACYRASWLVTGQSREIVADIAARFPGCRTYHLSNAVDIAAFRPEKASPEVRARLGGESACLAVYAGLHGLAQGLGQLLDAAEIVGPAVAMTLIGDGPEKPALVTEAGRRALGHVRFLDPLPRGDVPAAVASADIVLVPLRTPIPGAVPSKLYEAMASGRPVVLVADGEAADIVRRCDAGLVVRPGDIAGLARALERLSRDPDLRASLGANGRRAAEREFNRQAIGDRFVELLESSR